MKAYLGGAMLGSSVNASVEVVGVISKSKSNDNTIHSLSNSDFTKGEGWYQVILDWRPNDTAHATIDGLIYYDGTTFNGVLKGYQYWHDNFYGDITNIACVAYSNGNIDVVPTYTIHSFGYGTYSLE